MSEDINTQEQQDQLFSLRELWSMCLSRWMWFVGSVGLCLLVAVIYILKTPPVFTRQTSIMVKEEVKGKGITADVSQQFSDLGFINSRVNVYNEIVNFSTPDLMVEVVKRLHLETNYKMAGGLFKTGHRLYDRTLYGSSLPINVEFLDMGNNDGASFTVHADKDGQFVLKKLKKGKNSFKGNVVVTPGDTVETAIGRLILTKTANFNEEKGLDEDILVSRSGYYATTRSYLSRLGVALNDKESTVINISLNDVNTQRAVDVLNMMINVYNENWIKDKNQITNSTNEFIAERLQVIEAELGDVDSSISDFKSRNRMPSVQMAASMDMQLSVQASQQITDANNQISIARYLLSFIRDSKGKLLPANAGINEGSITSLINDYNTTLLQRNRLVESSSEENYLVKDLDRQLESMQSVIVSSIDNYIVAMNTQLKSYQSTQNMLDQRVVSNPQQAGHLLSDERQQKVKEALYLFLLQKREENELSQAFTAYNTRVVTMPGGGNSPIAPRKMMILLVALIMGLGMPLALIYFLSITNTTVRGRQDLDKMSAPFVGELPATFARKSHLWDHLIPSRSRRDNPEDRKIVVKARSRDVINEAFRVVRTNLEFMRGRAEVSTVVMFTSMNPGSGKTFISSNLSTAFAIKGKKVIAIDLDLRKKSLSAFAGNPKKGVSDYLAGKVDDFAPLVIHNIEGSGLDILPVGTLPPNPSELLSDPRLETLISSLRKSYDYIFLDCPPVEIVTDADIINRFADITIFVIRAGVLDRAMLPEINKFYLNHKYQNMAILLNGTDGGSRYGYRYGYKYGYSYGGKYGNYYGNEKEAEQA